MPDLCVPIITSPKGHIQMLVWQFGGTGQLYSLPFLVWLLGLSGHPLPWQVSFAGQQFSNGKG